MIWHGFRLPTYKMNADPIIDTDVAWSSICGKLPSNTSSMIKIDDLGVWHCSHPLSDDAVQLLDLYSPLVARPKSSKLVVAHLGQSLDGFIATASGDSHYVTGAENIIHLHRMLLIQLFPFYLQQQNNCFLLEKNNNVFSFLPSPFLSLKQIREKQINF